MYTNNNYTTLRLHHTSTRTNPNHINNNSDNNKHTNKQTNTQTNKQHN
jgi:hypothetical protein